MNEILSDTLYDEREFAGLRLDGMQIIASRFTDCRFSRASLRQCVFRECRFNNCVIANCDASVAQVGGCVFSRVRFEDSKLLGINWTEAKWSGSGRATLAFERCVLDRSSFFGLKLPGLSLRECSASDVDFREADLREAVFDGTDLAESLFANTNLTRADLTRARNYRIHPAQNTLARAKFALPEAMALLYCMDIVLTERQSEDERRR